MNQDPCNLARIKKGKQMSNHNHNSDVFCDYCFSVCAETEKEVTELFIDYGYRCFECGQLNIIRERRCNCGAESPAKNCLGDGPWGPEYCG